MESTPRGTPEAPTGGGHASPQTQASAASDEAPRADEKPATASGLLADKLQAPPKAPAAAEQDEVLFHGSVSLWLGWRAFAGAVLAVLLGLTLLVLGWWKAGWYGTAGVYIGLPLALAGASMFGYVFLALRCLRYKITGRLIERERGILVKRVDSLDLGRVKDVQLVQNLLERILRIGTIEILSSDRSDPLMRIEALPGPRPIYEKLRDTVIRIGRQRGIVPMDR